MEQPTINSLFNFLPPVLHRQLFDEFTKIHKNHLYNHFEPSELNAAKFCEVVYWILEGYLKNGNYTQEAKKPKNMVECCKQLEQFSSKAPRSIKILIPRLISAIYEIRNNRNVGHIGGDVSPNFMDGNFTFHAVNWIMAELIRVFHNTTVKKAQRIVDDLSSTGNIPIIWDINNRKRVLRPNLSAFEQTLIILYRTQSRSLQDLSADTKYSSQSMFKKRVLLKGDKDLLWEYDAETEIATISSLGIKRAEELIRSVP